MGGKRLLVLFCAAALVLGGLIPAHASSDPNSPRWVGHGPEGGEVLSVAVAPDGTVYAGTVAGLFRSTDHGDSWSRVAHRIQGRVTSIAVHPRKPAVVYAAAGGDIYRSSDFGRHWRRSLTGKQVDHIAFDTQHPFRVFAGGWGAFVSRNGGATWHRMGHGLPTKSDDPYFESIAVGPHGTVYMCETGLGVYRSSDHGRTWERSHHGFSVYMEFLDLVAPSAPAGTVFLVTYNGPHTFYRSRDAGRTWVPTGPRHVGQVLVDPADPRHLYVGSYDGPLYDSHDSLRSWNEVTATLPESVIPRAVDPTNGMRLFATSPDGVARSDDGGKTWTTHNAGFVATSVTAIAADPDDPTVALAGTDVGLMRTDDGGASWTPSETGIDAASVKELSWTGQGLYAATTAGLYRSDDAGQTWSEVGGFDSTTAFAIDPNDAETLYVCSGHLFKSTDGGATWTDITPPFTDFYGMPLPMSVVAVNPAEPKQIFAGAWTKGSSLYRSDDGGKSWIDVGGGLPNTFGAAIGSVAVDPTQQDTVFVGTDRGVFKSGDAGQTWNRSSHGLSRWSSVYQIVIDPSDPRTLYVPLGAVYRSTDAGGSWTPIGSAGLRTTTVDTIALTGSTLYAGTAGSGAYSRPLN